MVGSQLNLDDERHIIIIIYRRVDRYDESLRRERERETDRQTDRQTDRETRKKKKET